MSCFKEIVTRDSVNWCVGWPLEADQERLLQDAKNNIKAAEDKKKASQFDREKKKQEKKG